MKKFYAFVAAAMAAVSMNAQLYICGNGDGLGWDPTNPKTVEAEADGSYKFELKNVVEFKVSTVKGDWSAFNSGSLWINTAKSEFGKETKFYGGENNISVPWTGDYTFTLKFTTVADDEYAKGYSITTTTTPEPGFVIQDVYIRGDMNNWGTDAAWKFETTDGINYKFVCSGATKIYSGVQFKIATSDWNAVNNGTNAAIPFDSEVEFLYDSQSPNAKLTNDFEGTISFVMNSTRSNLNVLFSTQTSGIEDAVIETAEEVEYYNLQGVRVANPENGIFIARQGKKVYKVVK